MIHRRLGLVILAVPYFLGAIPLTVFSPFIWAVTGRNWDQLMESYSEFGVRAIEWASGK